jgi:hypothetical protein
MEKTKLEENERKKRVKEYVEALAVFIDQPELLKDDLLRVYVDLIKERIDAEKSKKQKQLADIIESR